MVDLARLAELKRLLNDGTLTREEFEALKQNELQAGGTDRGSDRGSDCASERSASPAPVTGAPVYGAATGNAVPGAPGASSTPTLPEMGDVFRKDLGVAGTNLVELVEASCVVLGVSVKGKNLAQQANECWRILQSPHGAHLPAGQASASACSDSKQTGGMKTTDPFAVPTTHDDDLHERISERLSRARASAASFASRRSSTRVAPAITESASSASSGLAVDAEAGQVLPSDRAESEGERKSNSRSSAAESAAPEESKETAGAVGFLRSKVGCLRMLIRVLSLTLFATWIATLVVCNARDEGFFGDAHEWDCAYYYGDSHGDCRDDFYEERKRWYTMRMTGVALVFAQGIVIVAARAALLLQVQQIGRRRVYGSLVLASALIAVGALTSLLLFTVLDGSSVRFSLKFAIYGLLLPAQSLELAAFVLLVPVVSEWRRRAICCAAWGAITVTATVAVICVYEGRAMAGAWGREWWNRGTVADSSVEAFRWTAAILAPSYYLADISSAINRPQVGAMPLCPPMNRKATAKRLGIAVLIFLVAVSALAGVIYVGTCRNPQSVFTSWEDLRREIDLYDRVCSSLFGNPIVSWDVSAVTDMSYLFSPYGQYGGPSAFSLRTFNQDISAWNVSAVTAMRYMFGQASSFNQDISAWNVTAVRDMSWMFYYASSFNQDINAWNVSAVRYMSRMFYYASSFDKVLCSDAWRASKSKASQSYMFSGTNGAGICE